MPRKKKKKTPLKKLPTRRNQRTITNEQDNLSNDQVDHSPTRDEENIVLELTNDIINETIEAETHQVLKNLRAILEEAGLSLSDIVKCSIFIKDMGQFGAINEVYASYFSDVPPARETVEVARLPKDVNVEISAIATR